MGQEVPFRLVILFYAEILQCLNGGERKHKSISGEKNDTDKQQRRVSTTPKWRGHITLSFS